MRREAIRGMKIELELFPCAHESQDVGVTLLVVFVGLREGGETLTVLGGGDKSATSKKN